MEITQINDVTIRYSCEGQGQDVILLHGWGQNIEMMDPIGNHLKDRFRVFIIDFPGFGESSQPPVAWGVEDYSEFLRAFVVNNDIKCPILIGHSFGCRVAIHYASKYEVKKMVLTGAAGLKPKHSFDYYVRIYTFKTLKKLTNFGPLKKYQVKVANYFGSSDYKNTDGVMRQTFVKVVNDDVKDLIPHISIPVLLIFGEKDDATPLWMGKYMEEHFPDAGLVVFEGASHYAYLEQLPRFLTILEAFLKNEVVSE